MNGKIIELSPTITALAEEKKYKILKEILLTLNAADIAAVFQQLDEKKLALLFRLLPKEPAAEAFVEMDSDAQEALIRGFSDTELKEIVDELFADDAADIVEEMPANVVKRILQQAEPAMRRDINELLRYPEDSAGSIMTTEFVDLLPTMTVGEAVKHIKRTGMDKETVNLCYVTSPGRQLVGLVSLRMLILADEDDAIGDIMEQNVIAVHTLADQEEVARMLSKYNFIAMPVVDSESRLVGIVTVDDALDVIQEEATEDIEKMAAITPSTKPYLKTSAVEIWKSRVPWLLLLMISATFTGMIITRFESALAAQTILVAFIPMLMDTGGNSGSQASVTVIRGLSLDEVHFSDTIRVIWKEIRVALLCGLTLAVCNFAKLMLFDRVGLTVSAVVCITLVGTVLVAKTVGCSLPLLAKKVGFDPAVMASPLLTTIVDALSLLIYFRIATQLLGL